MQITVTIPDETGARLAAQAQARGVALERLLRETLESTAAEPLADAEIANLSPEEREKRHAAVDAMLDFAAKHGFTTGGQDLKSMVHEGHKY